MKKHNIYNIVSCSIILFFTSCMKDFLDVKRDKSQVIPTALIDYQAILDHNNLTYYYSYLLGEIASDDYFISVDQWNGLSNAVHKNAYIWADDVYQGEKGEDWNRAYEKILHANLVIEGLEKITKNELNRGLYQEILGAAHYYRGLNFFILSQLYCKQFNELTATSSLGLPLKLSSNINEKLSRSNLYQTYEQIVSDLKIAALNLPEQVAVNTRPNKLAAWAMLSNVYLQKKDYLQAKLNADSVITLNSNLINYNDINVNATIPFPVYAQGNKEVLHYTHMSNAAILSTVRLCVDTNLYDSYTANDLRKSAFFRTVGQYYTFKGHYSGTTTVMFSGVTTAEMLLVRAECNTRMMNIDQAVSDMNLLLMNRYKTNTYVPIDGGIDQQVLLNKISSERRKELIFRGRRWSDLKRSDDESLSLRRILGDKEYVLRKGSPQWVFQLPPEVVKLGGYEQN